MQVGFWCQKTTFCSILEQTFLDYLIPIDASFLDEHQNKDGSVAKQYIKLFKIRIKVFLLSNQIIHLLR